MSVDRGRAASAGEDYIAEYEELRRIHVRNYAIYMGLIFGVGVVILLLTWLSFNEGFTAGQQRNEAFYSSARGRRSVATPSPAWYQPVQIGLIVAGALMGGFLLVTKRVFPLPLRCPKCEVRVDEVGLIDGHCPGCQVRLR